MSTFYFVAGASGSGKTAIISDLKKILGESIAVYDFDHIGVPDSADKKWRQESSEKWLQKLLSDGKDACLLGQIVLGEILSCPSAKQIDKINFCLLDVSDFERIQRLKNRNSYGADQNMLNWSAWLRMHHQDPKWTPHVIQDTPATIMDFNRLNQLLSYDDVANVQILDTTALTINKVAQQVADWIHIPSIKPFEIIKSQATDIEFIDNQIVEYNNHQVPFLQQEPFIGLNFCIKNETGIVVAGVSSVMYGWRILHIDLLLVVTDYRSKGFGSQLLNHVEKEAKQLGSTLVHLDTFDFQAKDFYLKYGYEIFGILEDCPPGHKRYYMKKIL